MERRGADFKVYVGGKKHFTTVYKIFNGKRNCKLDVDFVENYPGHSKQG